MLGGVLRFGSVGQGATAKPGTPEYVPAEKMIHALCCMYDDMAGALGEICTHVQRGLKVFFSPNLNQYRPFGGTRGTRCKGFGGKFILINLGNAT